MIVGQASTKGDAETKRGRHRGDLDDGGTTRTAQLGLDHVVLVAIAVLTCTALILALLVRRDGGEGVPFSLRVLIGVATTVLVPGVPIALMVRIPDPVITTAVGISLSLSVNIIVAQSQFVIGAFHPTLIQTVLCGLSLLSCAVAWKVMPYREIGPPRVGRRRMLAGVTITVAVLFFAVAVRTLDTAAAGAAGIIPEIGWAYYVALFLVSLVAGIALTSRRLDAVVLTVAALTLITFTTLLVSLADGVTSIPTAYVHRGLIEILVHFGELPPPSDARFSWAGFFSGSAQMSTAYGITDFTAIFIWAPVFFNAMIALPIYSIGLSISRSRRVAWLGVFVYLLFNWYQQDYFAPQPTAMMFYTSVIAVLLWQLRRAPLPVVEGGLVARTVGASRRTPGRVPGQSSAQTLAVEAILVVILAAMVVTHQLTPMVMVGALLMFTLTGSTRYRLLWVAAGALFLVWFSYGAVDYWKGHLQALLSDVGQVSGAVQGGVSKRIGSGPTYQAMQYLRLAATGFMGLLGFLGWVLTRGRKTWLMSGVLCVVPFGLVAVQSYGGEVVIRCFVMAAPILAPLGAVTIVRSAAALRNVLMNSRRRRGGRIPRVVMASLSILVLSVILTATRGLNTSFEHSSPYQIRIGDALLASVPDGATIMAWGPSAQLVSPRILTGVTVSQVDSIDCLDNFDTCVADRDPDYVFVAQQASSQISLQYGYPAGMFDDAIADMLASGNFEIVVENADVTVLRRAGAPEIDLEQR